MNENKDYCLKADKEECKKINTRKMRNTGRMRRFSAAVFTAAVACFGLSIPCSAAVPYRNYTYSTIDIEPYISPQAYLPSRVIDGNFLGTGELKEPGDMYVSKDGMIYLLDSGNNRIICMDGKFKVQKVINEFINDGKKDMFSNPQGIFVNDKGHIYVADTGNARVIELDGDGGLVKVTDPPKSDILPKEFIYKPRKLVVDNASRMYVVGEGVFEGIIQFDSGGKFTGFIGANKVTFNAWDYFWKKFSTKAQKEGMIMFVPTDLSNVDIDGKGFIYTTIATMIDNQGVKKLNATGSDIIKQNETIRLMGDAHFTLRGSKKGFSSFIDVCVQENGIYSCLDRTRGRIFTYDNDGDMLYIFGGLGEQEGLFKYPAAIDSLGDDMLVLDQGLNRLTVFKLTDYGRLIKDAVRFHYAGRYNEATEMWKDILKVNINCELAYIGVGKALLRQKDYSEAMQYFRLGNSKEHYSKAFKLYRKDIAGGYFGYIVLALAIAAALIILFKRIRLAANRIRIRRRDLKYRQNITGSKGYKTETGSNIPGGDENKAKKGSDA